MIERTYTATPQPNYCGERHLKRTEMFREAKTEEQRKAFLSQISRP